MSKMDKLSKYFLKSKEEPEKISKTAEVDASLFSKLIYSWMYPLIRRGASVPLEISDIPPLSAIDKSSENGRRFGEIYNQVRKLDLETKNKNKNKNKENLDFHSNKWRQETTWTAFVSSIIGYVPPSWATKTSRSLYTVTAKPFIIGGLWKPVWLLAAITQALSIGYLIKFLAKQQGQSPSPTSRWAYLPLVLLMSFSSFAMSISQHAVFYYSLKAAIQARGALASQIFRKTLRLRQSVFNSLITEGEIGNLLVTDLQRVFDSFNYVHFCWSGIIDLIVFFSILAIDLKLSALIGFSIVALLIPLQILFSNLAGKGRTKVTAAADVRVQQMNEILSGIRMIKYCAWETHFKDSIQQLRRNEVQKLKATSIIRALNSALYFATPIVISTIIFTSHTILFNRILTPEVAFTSVSLLSIMSRILILIPLGWLGVTEGSVSFQRLDRFFDLPELPEHQTENGIYLADYSKITHGHSESQNLNNQKSSGDINVAQLTTIDTLELEGTGRKGINETESIFRILVNKASFSYDLISTDQPSNHRNVIHDASLSAKNKELVCVLGNVGSGKTCLLSGIIGEIQQTEGVLYRNGSIAYCAQKPWILNGTVRKNITLFGTKFEDENFDQEWYDKVLDCCCLLPDLESFPASDLTEIDKITISGGQKARIALARAIYSCAEIYILDDPLSAVDATISARIIDKVLGKNGILSKHTCIIATHNTRLLSHATQIMLLDNGKMSHCGNYEKLRSQPQIFDKIQGFLETDLKTIKDPSTNFSNNEKKENRSETASQGGGDEIESEFKNPDTISSSEELKENKIERLDYSKGKLVSEEDRKYGKISFRVFLSYLAASGGFIAVSMVLIAFISAQVARQFAQIWIGKWTTLIPKEANVSTSMIRSDNIKVFKIVIGLSLGTLGLTMIRAGMLSTMAMIASRRLHNQLLLRILYAKTSFFDTNPVGRILNRFSKDIDIMDMTLPMVLQDVLQVLILSFGSLITISWVLPWFLVAIPPIFLSFMCLQILYKRTSRELKRLDGISFSPIYSNFVQSLSGFSTIRAFANEDVFSINFDKLVDQNHATTLMFQTSGRWVGIRLDILSFFVVFVSGFVVVALGKSIDVGLAGVALSESILLTGALQWGIRQAAECENIFTSVERVVTMSNETPVELEHTDEYQGEEDNTGIGWPSGGVISFENVSMKYRPEHETVLHEINFQTKEREKVGVCGRSGSGKSSILVCLFRFVELQSGSIKIDGHDISGLNLRKLRSSMAIVPQDPCIFNGTVRKNLDPNGESSDAQIWDALRRVNMIDRLKLFANEFLGLDTVIKEKGGNMSVGEKQLLALARAILSRAKIIILDEASSSLDNYTDMVIQKTIQTEFADKTVITIAHRLKTVMECDRILVINNGKVVEFDSPLKLINSGGKFSEMVASTGHEES